ncbi:DUF6197 family protein [Faunimonas sp. B44]|uniref:DUF6197 family protein n=1 Tax=Faunimonas sp. B44 TaxID=3461493 RepID=UPI0040441D0F
MSTIEKQIAEHALEIIKQGWYQDDYCNAGEDLAAGTCFCALGAINRASYKLQGASDTIRRIEDRPEVGAVTDRLRHIVGAGVSAWNDDPDRTKEEVVTAFEKLVASYA